MKISLFSPLSIHEIGQRTNQEDSIIQCDNRLFVLCDGMGGHEHGEVASQTVCQAICDWFQTRAVEPLTKSQMEDALAYAYVQLEEKDGGELRKMGTTLTLLCIGSNGVFAAHMGDSRIYHIRPGVGVLYQSRDHSLVFDLFQSGEITYEEMATYPQKNIITRAMQPGEDNRARMDITHITDIQPGDYFYMCSDGMLEQMSNGELTELLSSQLSDEEKRQQFIRATAHNQDNHSAWIIHVRDVVREKGDDSLVNEEPVSRYNAVNIIRSRQAEDNRVEAKPIAADGEDDVVVVSSPEQRKPTITRKPLPKILLIVLSLCTILFAVLCVLFFVNRCKSPEQIQKPKPINIGRPQIKVKKSDTIIVIAPQKQQDTIKRTEQKNDTIRRNEKNTKIETTNL